MGRYRVIRAYGPWSKDHVFTDMPGNVGRTLAARGLVVEEKSETKAMASPANRMMKVPLNRATREQRP